MSDLDLIKLRILAKTYAMGKTIVKLHLHAPPASFQYKKEVTQKHKEQPKNKHAPTHTNTQLFLSKAT